MPPSLVNAYKRVDWGRGRLSELEALHRTTCETNARAIFVEEYAEPVVVRPGEFGPPMGKVNVQDFVPIPDDIFKFTYLEGVTDAHAAMIETLQPYKECGWTRNLRDLSNRDKHSDLVIVQHGLRVHTESRAEPPRGRQGRAAN